MERICEIEHKNVGLKCSAGTVRTYRKVCGRDLIVDMSQLEKELVESKTLSPDSVEIAENVSYFMAKEYDNTIEPIEEWLSGFSPYFVYNVMAQCIIMWHDNLHSITEAKKN